MYIDNSTKERVKGIPILEVAKRLNIRVVNKKQAHCFYPEHEDTHPSLTFKPENNTWKCFSCPNQDGSDGGDAITLVMRCKGLSFPDAVVWLAQNFNIYIPDAKKIRKKYNANKIPYKPVEKPVSKVIEPDTELMQWLVDIGGLCDEAKTFLFQERKYTESVIADRKIFSIKDQYKFVQAIIEKFGKERALASQLVRQKDDRFISTIGEKCVVFPYFDIDGNVINFQSRKYVACDKRFRYLFPAGLSVHAYNLDKLNLEYDTAHPLYIAEGVTDCLAMMCDGKNAIAIPGVNNFNPDDIEWIQRYRLLMYPDNDTAGKSLISALNEEHEMNVGILSVPEPYGDYCDYYTGTR